MRVILIALTTVTMINGGNNAGLFVKLGGRRAPSNERGVTASGEEGSRPPSIFPKVVSWFHNNTLLADSLFSSSGN